MAAAGFLVTLAIFLVSSSSISNAFDNDPLQDFCVAVPDASAAGKSNSKLQFWTCFIWDFHMGSAPFWSAVVKSPKCSGWGKTVF